MKIYTRHWWNRQVCVMGCKHFAPREININYVRGVFMPRILRRSARAFSSDGHSRAPPRACFHQTPIHSERVCAHRVFHNARRTRSTHTFLCRLVRRMDALPHAVDMASVNEARR